MFIVLLGQLPLQAGPAQAAQGLDMYFKAESGPSSQMTTSAFKTGTCFTSPGDLNQNWEANSPGGTCPTDGFTMYAEGFIKAPATGTVTFYSATDDGFLLNINNQTIISDLNDHGLGQPYNGTGSMQMTAGTYYPIKVWFHENFGLAALFLRWTYPGVTQQTQITANYFDTEAPPADQENPVVVVGSGVLSSPTVEAGQSFSITYRVTDDVACCNQHDVLFYNSQNQSSVAFSAPSAQISGTPTNVTYRANVSVGTSIQPGTYIAKTQTTDLAGKFTFLQEIGSIQVTAPIPKAPTPALSTATSTVGGFTTQITNYDASYSWIASTTSGAATISATGLVSVTGLQPLASATVTVTSSKDGFTNGQASRVGSALDGDPEAVVPQFAAAPATPGTPNTAFGTSVLGGCDAQISNYNSRLTWSGSSTSPGSTVTISNTGRIQVRGMLSQITAQITIQNSGANNTTRQATFECLSWYPIFSIQSSTTSTIVLKTNYLAGITYDLVPSSGTVTNSLDGNVTISNLQASTDVSLTVKTYSGTTLIWPRSGQGSGILPLGKTLAGQTQSPITFTLPALTVGTTSQLSASGGSGNGAFSFTSNSTNICTVSGSTLTPVAAGTCSITATKAGDATFAEAKSTQSATVAQAGVPTLSITSPTTNQTLTGSFTLSASAAIASGSTARLTVACLFVDGVANNAAAVNNGLTYWSSGLNNRGPAGNCYDIRSLSSTTIRWDLDATTWSNGDHQISVRVYDSANKESALVSVPVKVTNPAPEITSLLPKSGSLVYGDFNVEVRWTSASSVTHIGVSLPCTSQTSGAYSQNPTIKNPPSGMTYFNVSGVRTLVFTCAVDADLLLKTESKTSRDVTVLLIDRAGQTVDQSTQLLILSPKPALEIRSPLANQTVRGEIQIELWAKSPSETSRKISYVGISESKAKASAGAYSSYYGSRMPSKYTPYSISNNQSGEWLNFVWTLDLAEFEPGLRTVEVAVQDTNGDYVEQSVQFLVQNPELQLDFLTPLANQVIQGDVEIKVLAKPDALTKHKINIIAIDLKGVEPTFVGSQMSEWQSKVPRNFRAWEIEARSQQNQFSWRAEAGSIPNGTYTVTVIAFDDKGFSKKSTTQIVIATPNPEVRISKPNAGVVGLDSLELTMNVQIPKSVNAKVDLVGINVSSAVPGFVAQPVRLNNSNQLRDFTFWRVDNASDFTWTLNPANWPDGDRTITVMVLDSNNKIGQTSILLHKAPSARWNIVVKDPPVLGKSVAIGVTMTTSSERRPEPQVTARLQTSSSPKGPWADAGILTFDKAGVAAGRVVVTSPMYVRVYHDTLDTVLPGASDSLRIVNVPDPSRNIRSKTSGDTNEDGSIPTVTCTPPQRASLNKRLTVSCTAVDVQNPAQPLNTYVQQGKTFRKVGTAQMEGNLIRFSVTVKKAGTYIFEVRGEGQNSRFTQWRSNRITISVKK